MSCFFLQFDYIIRFRISIYSEPWELVHQDKQVVVLSHKSGAIRTIAEVEGATRLYNLEKVPVNQTSNDKVQCRKHAPHRYFHLTLFSVSSVEWKLP